MRFTKMHGIGNDYVYVSAFTETVERPEILAQRISDRHFGVGGDGLIMIEPSEKADVRMRMFNADGSEAEMCGNGVRCVAKYTYEHLAVQARPDDSSYAVRLLREIYPEADSWEVLTVETGRGVLPIALVVKNGRVVLLCVNMGEPILTPGEIPVKVIGQQAVGIPIVAAEESFLMTCVSMGNPHAVIYCEDVEAVDLQNVGPLLERHEMFPNRMNVHFVQRCGPAEVIMRTWERGSGITLACGTGAAAVCVAGVLASKTEPRILAHLPGGDLYLEWQQQDNCVYMIGPAEEVFSGEWVNGAVISSPSSGASS